ncbi:MAG: caspase family protein [Pirellulales bacterium]
MNIHLLTFGINYVGTPYELRGCIPDSKRVIKRLKPYCKTATMRTEHQCEDADEMLEEARKVRHRLDRDDLMVIHDSSHGTWKKTSDPSEPSGGNQGIVARNMSVLWDDIMAAECADRAEGSFIFAIIDACHPGSIQRGGLLRPRCIPYSRCKQRRDTPTGLQMRALDNCWGFHGAGDGPTDYCYDAEFKGKPAGAMTYFTLKALDEIKRGATYRDWFRYVGGRNGKLPSDEYPQSPVLVGSDRNLRRPVPFI